VKAAASLHIELCLHVLTVDLGVEYQYALSQVADCKLVLVAIHT